MPSQALSITRFAIVGIVLLIGAWALYRVVATPKTNRLQIEREFGVSARTASPGFTREFGDAAECSNQRWLDPAAPCDAFAAAPIDPLQDNSADDSAADPVIREAKWIADMNEDGKIDESDFVMFASAYEAVLCELSEAPDACPGDINGDDVIDDADFDAFFNAFDLVHGSH